MGLDLPEGRGEGVPAALQLDEAAGTLLVGELAAYVGGFGLAGEEETGFEDRLVSHDLEEILELHGGKLPWAASSRHGFIGSGERR